MNLNFTVANNDQYNSSRFEDQSDENNNKNNNNNKNKWNAQDADEAPVVRSSADDDTESSLSRRKSHFRGRVDGVFVAFQNLKNEFSMWPKLSYCPVSLT